VAEESTPAPAPKPSAPPPAPPAPLIPVARLIEESEAFLGVPPYVVAGALHQRIADLTVADAKAQIDAWLQKPVDQEVR
jgi:hypothetical protein